MFRTKIIWIAIALGLPLLASWPRLNAEDASSKAPQAAGGARLPGNPSPRFWSFQPPREPAVPAVQNTNLVKDPIDRFILKKLEAAGLRPNPPAAKETLLRRASFDLTGLPPAPSEIEAFLADQSPDAFARIVDRLLDSVQFGERWGRHWLDVARYADSNGLELNTPYDNAWRYRDYVVEAFNQDKPFHRFIQEQIAGDLLPFSSDSERYDLLTATGFLVMGPKALFEPNQEKLIMDVADEQIDVTSRAFLGLTISCARCHDHKYDPIPTREYYAMAGIFKSTATLDFGGSENRPNPRRWMERPLAPIEQAKAIEEHTAALAKTIEALRAAAQRKTELPGDISSAKLAGLVMDNAAAELTGAWKDSFYATKFVDKNYIHDGNADKGKKSARFTPNLPRAGKFEVLLAYNSKFNRATNVPVTIQSADGTRLVRVNQRLDPPIEDVFVSLGVFPFHAGALGSVAISNEGTSGFVIVDAVRFVPVDESPAAMMADKNNTAPAPLPQPSPAPAMADSMRPYEQLEEDFLRLRENTPPPVPMAMAVQEGRAANSRVHLRGEIEKLGEEVSRGAPSLLQSSGAPALRIPASASGRLELARWIASESNPLTARVAVNRIWLHLFGQGLAGAPDNFGALSEPPTHPELLDFLALRFIENGWSHKKLIRRIMLTRAYQMSSDMNPAAHAIDPDNKSLWRMNRRRLEAEAIRDAILRVSGQLDLAVGGTLVPSAGAPLDVPAIFNPRINSNRRSLYLPVIRNDVQDFFQVFDFGDPHFMNAKRHATAAPTQSLFLMNSPFVVDQAQQWAETLLSKPFPSHSARVQQAYLEGFGRKPRPREIDNALKFIQSFPALNASPAPASAGPSSATASDTGRWTAFCQALIASTEFRFLD